MDSQDYVGSCSALRVLLSYSDVSRVEFVRCCYLSTTHVGPATFAEFLKAVAAGDESSADAFLRSWGIR